MPNRREPDPMPQSANRAPWPAYHKTNSNSRRGDSLSSDDVDAEIRWFFENTPGRETLDP
jgi:hypothetical protein